MTQKDIQVGEEYVILVPTRVRAVTKNVASQSNGGQVRRNLVLVEQVDSGILMAVRCDRVKDPATVPFHRARLS